MARRERTAATVRRTARCLPSASVPSDYLPGKRRDAYEHGGGMREGWAARCNLCAANSARVVAALQ